MRNLNIYRDRSPGLLGGFSKWVLAGLGLLCLGTPAIALDPFRLLSQYLREHWGSERGFTGTSVSAIGQTSDGYLWIGTDKGLIRFDGFSFQLVQQAGPDSVPVGPVQGLTGDAEGNLWVLLQNAKILRYRDGEFAFGREETEFGVTALGRRQNGAALFSSLALGSLSFRGGRFESLSTPNGDLPKWEPGIEQDKASNSSPSAALPISPCRECSHVFADTNSAVVAMGETNDGKIWLATREKGLFYAKDGRLVSVGKAPHGAKLNCLLPMDNGELWIGTERGVIRWNGKALTTSEVPPGLRDASISAMLRDRDSNIWLGTARGILRVTRKHGSTEVSGESSAPVTALFEDREGNLWAGGPIGIERFRDGAFASYPLSSQQSESPGPVYADDTGRVWFAPFEGGLHWLKDGKIRSVSIDGLDRDVVYSITGAKNDLWIGRRLGGLTHLKSVGESITTNTYTRADGLAQNGVYAVYQAKDETIWAATLNSGISQLKDGRFTTYTTASGLISDTVTSIAETPDGTMWFATPNGLDAFANGRWRAFSIADGLPANGVNCLFPDSTGTLWIGTDTGLASLRTGQTVAQEHGEEAALKEAIMGIGEDRNGLLWIATSGHVLSVNRDKLLAGLSESVDARTYGPADGLLGTEGVKRQYSVFADKSGRIWFATNRGLSFADLSRAYGNFAPALVKVASLTSDDNASDLKRPVRIPAGGHKVTFNYSALSLSAPEMVRFKYKLDGFDQGWNGPVANREAVYTNLGSGSYRFRVIASNGYGQWNSAESAIPFTIEPVFWQTWWFRLSCVAAIALMIFAYTRVRVTALTRQLNLRFEERLAERTRIAQDLHDTLLQGLLSASMQLHVANEQLERDSPAKPLVNRVLQLMTRVTNEGRNAVRGLRASNRDSVSLEQAFSTIPQELAIEDPVSLRVVVEGMPRKIRAPIRDEIYLVGREGLVNALRHSGAKEIDVEIEYAPNHLRLLVSDNGSGIDPQVLSSGREGHWGLSGMRERAERIGAKLKLLSRAAAGTEIELSIPAALVYEPRSSRRTLRFLSAFQRRSSKHAKKN